MVRASAIFLHTINKIMVNLLNLSPAQYECFSFNNPTSNSIREDIIKQNNIVHYPKFEDSSDAPLWLRGLT